MTASFYKLKRHRLVSGVLAGLADKFGLSVTLLRFSSCKWTVFVSHLLYQIELGESSGSISINVPIVAKSIDESEKSI